MFAFKSIFAMAILSTIISCATVHNGRFAEVEGSTTKSSEKPTTKTGLVVSGSEMDSLASTYVTALDFTFENTTNTWMKITKVEIDFGSGDLNQNITFPVGNELIAWAESAKQREAINLHNTAVVLGAISAMGALVATSNDKNFQTAGTLAAAGGAGALTAQSLVNTKRNLELSKLVPSSHIFSDSFIIPPGLHTKKWLTLFTAKPLDLPYVEDIHIVVTLGDGTKEKVKLKFRNNMYAPSEWQKGHKTLKKIQAQQST